MEGKNDKDLEEKKKVKTQREERPELDRMAIRPVEKYRYNQGPEGCKAEKSSKRKIFKIKKTSNGNCARRTVKKEE